MDAMIGRMLGSYRITEQLGRGGMATVYKAYHAALDRHVAVKVLPEYFAHDPTFFERFQQEAQAVARLRHPNIMQVFDFGREGDLTYLVMEFLEGGTLQDRLRTSLPLTDALRITRQVADALGYAHARGIVHRDVKPSNILISKDGDAVLSDFGIAKMVERAVSLTKTGVGVGTPEYMAPEQGQGLPVDGRSDIYSLGVVLYEMVTGRVPYIAETPLAIVLKHMNDPLPMPRLINPAVPQAVQELVVTCLAKSPTDRYQSADALVQAIDDAIAAGEMTAPGAMTMPEIATGRRTPPPRSMTPPPGVSAVAPAAAGQAAVAQPAQQPAVAPPYQPPPSYPPAQAVPGVVPAYQPTGQQRQQGRSGFLLGAVAAILLLIFGAAAALGGFALRDRLSAKDTATPTTTRPAATGVVLPTVTTIIAMATATSAQPATTLPTATTGTAIATATAAKPAATAPPAAATATTAPAATTPATPTSAATPAPAAATATLTPRPAATATAGQSGGAVVAPATSTPVPPTATVAKPATFAGRIVYTHYRGPSRYGDFDVMIMDVPGGTPRKIADRGSEPTFSPDGKSILYYSWNQSGFFVMNSDGSGQRRISNSTEDAYPSWSRDGKRIAFTLYENRYNIWVMNADGSGRTKIVDGGEQPTWSADGSRIMYKGCVGSNCGLVVANADGGNKKLLTDNANDSSPAWSPGGGYVLFTSNRSGNLDVWVMRADGTGLQQLTTNPTSDGAATWSPDGNYIFFRSDREGSWAIYMMNDDGSNQRKIVSANVSERWWWERISVSW